MSMALGRPGEGEPRLLIGEKCGRCITAKFRRCLRLRRTGCWEKSGIKGSHLCWAKIAEPLFFGTTREGRGCVPFLTMQFMPVHDRHYTRSSYATTQAAVESSVGRHGKVLELTLIAETATGLELVRRCSHTYHCFAL